jgi:hypothetical protein
MTTIRVLKPFIFSLPGREDSRTGLERRFGVGVHEIPDEIANHPWIRDTLADGHIEGVPRSRGDIAADLDAAATSDARRLAFDKQEIDRVAADKANIEKAALDKAAADRTRERNANADKVRQENDARYAGRGRDGSIVDTRDTFGNRVGADGRRLGPDGQELLNPSATSETDASVAENKAAIDRANAEKAAADQQAQQNNNNNRNRNK